VTKISEFDFFQKLSQKFDSLCLLQGLHIFHQEVAISLVGKNVLKLISPFNVYLI
jgi:hypothetical protein